MTTERNKLKNLKFQDPGVESGALRKEIITMLAVAIIIPILFVAVLINVLLIDENGLLVTLGLLCVTFIVWRLRRILINKR